MTIINISKLISLEYQTYNDILIKQMSAGMNGYLQGRMEVYTENITSVMKVRNQFEDEQSK